MGDPPPEGPTVVDYDAGWDRWSDMIRFSPAPWHRRRLILAEARALSFASALDVGCGSGELLAALAECFEAEWTGADLSPAVVESNRTRFPGLHFETLDLETGALERRFDLVVCSEVLEHCADLDAALRNLRRMTAGHLIATVPAGPVFPIDRAMGHHRHFTAPEFSGLLAQHGFEPLRVRRWGFPFHSAYKLAINARPGAMLEQFAGGHYGAGQKALGVCLRGLFHLNVVPRGWQLVAVARSR